MSRLDITRKDITFNVFGHVLQGFSRGRASEAAIIFDLFLIVFVIKY